MDHRSLRGERDEYIDAKLGELFNHPVGPARLGDGGSDGKTSPSGGKGIEGIDPHGDLLRVAGDDLARGGGAQVIKEFDALPLAQAENIE